jgi:hypothetical protein
MGDGPPNALHVTPSSVAACKWLVVGGVGFVREAFVDFLLRPDRGMRPRRRSSGKLWRRACYGGRAR